MREVNHIGIILDGNRRFSKRLMKEPWKGHEYGAEKLTNLLEWVNELGVKTLTLYVFSVQNFSRPKIEFDYLMNLFRRELGELMDKRADELNEKGIKINFIGRIKMFPEDIQEKMNQIMEITKNNKDRTVNFAMGYGGREEIIDAVKKLGRDLESGKINANEINSNMFEDYLYMVDEPDFIIRTGGELRTSNFLLWQSHYSEWFFLEKMWPEFEKEDLFRCFNEFKNRERRFGK